MHSEKNALCANENGNCGAERDPEHQTVVRKRCVSLKRLDDRFTNRRHKHPCTY